MSNDDGLRHVVVSALFLEALLTEGAELSYRVKTGIPQDAVIERIYPIGNRQIEMEVRSDNWPNEWVTYEVMCQKAGEEPAPAQFKRRPTIVCDFVYRG